MAKNNKSLISYAIIGILLLVFGVYTSTMQYADAISLSTVTVGSTDTRGSTYGSQKNSWYFVSPTSDTIVKVIDNTTTVTTTPIGGTCVAGQNIIATFDGDLIVLCDNGAPASWTVEARTVNNPEIRRDVSESSFTNTDGSFTMLEWKQQKRMYILNGGGTSQNIAFFNNQKINSTSETWFVGTFDTSAQCNRLHGGVIVESSNEMFYVCERVGTLATSIARWDLTTSIQTQFVSLTAGGAGVGDIDHNTKTDKLVAVVSTTVYVVGRSGFTVEQSLVVCNGANEQLYNVEINENTNQAWLLCVTTTTGAQRMIYYDIASNSVVSSSAITGTDAGAQGGTNHFESMHWEDGRKALYLSYGWINPVGAGANTVTRISDGTVTSSIGGTVCIDTNPLEDFVSITCFTDVDNDGIPDSQIGQFPTVAQNTTSLVNQIGCQAGLISCTNQDSKTNGTGLMLLLLLLLASIGTVMFVTFRTDHSMNDVHPVIWFILVIAVTGVSWQLGWTDALPFFASIIAICALGAFKVREWFG
jgi:hypothetical protein